MGGSGKQDVEPITIVVMIPIWGTRWDILIIVVFTTDQNRTHTIVTD